MVAGQIGALVFAQSHVVGGLEKDLEFVIILHQSVMENSVLAIIQELRNAMKILANKVSVLNLLSGAKDTYTANIISCEILVFLTTRRT